MADPGRHTRAYPFSLSLFTLFSLFRVLQYLAQISTFQALARILPFPDTHPDPSPVLIRIPPFRYSPGFLLFSHSPGCHLSGTHLDPFPILARIPPFWYSPGSHLFNTLPDPTFSVLARISTFPTLSQILLFRHSLGFLPFPGTHPDPSSILTQIPPFRHSSGFYLFRYSSGSNLFRCLHEPFSGVCPDFLIFSSIALGFHYLFWHCTRFSLSPSVGATLFC